jgi:hypothetical protein
MTATYTIVVKVDTEIIQETSTVTYGIITDVITNTNLRLSQKMKMTVTCRNTILQTYISNMN